MADGQFDGVGDGFHRFTAEGAGITLLRGEKTAPCAAKAAFVIAFLDQQDVHASFMYRAQRFIQADDPLAALGRQRADLFGQGFLASPFGLLA